MDTQELIGEVRRKAQFFRLVEDSGRADFLDACADTLEAQDTKLSCLQLELREWKRAWNSLRACLVLTIGHGLANEIRGRMKELEPKGRINPYGD